MRAATQRAGSPWRSPSKGLRSSTEVPSHQHLLLPNPVWDVPKRERNFFLLFRGSAHFSGVINRARCRLWLGCEWMGWEGLGRVREQGAGIVLAIPLGTIPAPTHSPALLLLLHWEGVLGCRRGKPAAGIKSLLLTIAQDHF